MWARPRTKAAEVGETATIETAEQLQSCLAALQSAFYGAAGVAGSCGARCGSPA